MAIKDIVVPVLNEAEDEAALAAVETLSLLNGAHAAAVVVSPLPEPIVSAEGGLSAISLGEVIASALADSKEAAERLAARRGPVAFEVRLVEAWMHQAVDAVIAHARHADLAVMALAKPNATSSRRRDIFEGLLLGSGRGVLAAPQSWRPAADLRRVMIAWDGSREAVRAVAEAAPFLAAASHVTVATIDARPSLRGVGSAPGADIATHLARHQCDVELRNLDGMGREPGEAVLSAAIDMDASLIVMGAYHHARLRQALFGGVTRTLVEASPIPLLLAH